MTETRTPVGKSEGPARPPGARAVRPKAAATVIIVREDGPELRILMGRRAKGHSFMPDRWVFPGGRVDRADYRAPSATELSPEVAATLDAHNQGSRARALGLAAIRETYEEAGLLLAQPADPRPAAGPWREFLAHGAAPDLGALDVVARAITPPDVGKRFDTWFFTARAERLLSLDRLPDCGELDDIAWVTVAETADITLPRITRVMLAEAMERHLDPGRPRPFSRYRGGVRTITHL